MIGLTSQTTLTLRRAIWNQSAGRSVMNRVLGRSEVTIVQKLRDNIDNSTPAGRMYARGVKTTRATPANRNLRRAPGRKTRVIIGAQFFRSSAAGQPPARRFSKLYNSFTARRSTGKLQLLVEANAPGAAVLDDPKKLNRPYFRSVIDTYRRTEFLADVKGGVRELLHAGSA